MPASAWLLGVSVASLNLCTDEYLLLLAQPQEIASVSFLSQDPLESPLWRLARHHHANRGSVEDILSRRPNIVLTMGGGGRATSMIARRLGIRTVELTPVTSLEEVERNLHRVASALGKPERALSWLTRITALRRSVPRNAKDSIWLYGGGMSVSADSSAAQWLRLAGLRQRALEGDRATLETLLVRPPSVLIRNSYRPGQMSQGSLWFDHPIVRRVRATQLSIDGRAWRCSGPLVIAEVERLKKSVR